MAAWPSPRLHHTFIYHIVNHPSDMEHWHRDSLVDAQASWMKPGAPALLPASVQQYCPLLILYTRRPAADPARPFTHRPARGSAVISLKMAAMAAGVVCESLRDDSQ
jgi:hypothetical protein